MQALSVNILVVSEPLDSLLEDVLMDWCGPRYLSVLFILDPIPFSLVFCSSETFILLFSPGLWSVSKSGTDDAEKRCRDWLRIDVHWRCKVSKEGVGSQLIAGSVCWIRLADALNTHQEQKNSSVSVCT